MKNQIKKTAGQFYKKAERLSEVKMNPNNIQERTNLYGPLFISYKRKRADEVEKI